MPIKQQISKNLRRNVNPGNFWQVNNQFLPSLKGDRTGGTLWWVFFAILLYATDIFVTRFNGFNIDIFINTFTRVNLESAIRIFLNAGAIAGIVAYAIIKKPNAREFLSSVIIIELMWVVFSFGGYVNPGALLHLVFGVFIWIFLIMPAIEDRVQANLLVAVCIFVDFFLFSIIAKLAPNLPYFNRLIIPIWFFVALAFTKESGVKGFLVFLVIMFYVFNAFAVVNEYRLYQAGTETLGQREIHTAREYAKTSFGNMKDFVVSVFKFQANKTLGEYSPYYTGEIDKNAELKLGVYIEDIQAADFEFDQDQPVTVWGTLVANTIDEQIDVILSCKADEKEISDAEVYPSDSFDIENFEEENIECTFEPGSLEEGMHAISLNANFNFLTMAYIKTYFMEKETKRALTVEGIDPLEHYSIYDKDPVAVYTNGPVMIGLNIGKPPLTPDRDFRIGLTITNIWKGKINEITDIYIVLPEEIILINERENGYICKGKEEYIFRRSSCEDIGEEEKGCDNNIHNVYKIDLENKTIENIENYETISCRIDIENENELLGDTPITTKYFKVVTRYNYEIDESIDIEIKAGDSVKTVLSEGDCSAMCPDEDGCLCPEGCVIAENEAIDAYTNCGGFKRDDEQTTLANCSEECFDLDGCICPNDCLLDSGSVIGKGATCGGNRYGAEASVVYTEAPSELSIKINSDAENTTDRNVGLTLHAKNAQECAYTNDNDVFNEDDWEAVREDDWTKSWVLKDLEGKRYVWFACRNNLDIDDEYYEHDTINYVG